MFDFFRVLRKRFKTTDIVTYMQDILFWILTGISMLYCIYTFNSGEIRLYEFIGILIGTTIYFLTISKYFIKINSMVLNILTKIFYVLLIVPLKTINKTIKKPIVTFFDKIIHKNSFKSINFLKRFNKNVAFKKDFKI
jgi:spore cortex biosynthesis protein YabQ